MIEKILLLESPNLETLYNNRDTKEYWIELNDSDYFDDIIDNNPILTDKIKINNKSLSLIGTQRTINRFKTKTIPNQEDIELNLYNTIINAIKNEG